MPKVVNAIRPDSVSLPLREGAAIAGCSFDTLKRAVDAGELPAFRLGRGTKKAKWFVKRETLLAWIDKLERVGV
jgi:hypothetical protein